MAEDDGRLMKQHETGSQRGDTKRDLEEMYMKLHAKIGRDYVHKDDLEAILRNILGQYNLNHNVKIFAATRRKVGAKKKSQEYKELLDKGEVSKEEDLVKIDG